MKLKAFKVQMYRPILDSGWVDVDDITVIVGKNESGKTALLRALHKFNPFDANDVYVLDREWPRGRRRERSDNHVVVTTHFDFENMESQEIASLLGKSIEVEGVEISKTYLGQYGYEFLPDDDIVRLAASETVESLLKQLTPNVDTSDGLREILWEIQNQEIESFFEIEGASVEERIEEYTTRVFDTAQEGNEQDDFDAENAKNVLMSISDLSDVVGRRMALEELVHGWIPTFIYMDDHKPFRGSAYLDQLNQRKDSNRLTEEDSTFLMILAMAGLDFDEEYGRSGNEDKEQRMLDMSDASSTLTALLADHWSQRKYEVTFHADGYHVIAFVKDEIQSALVPLEERSKGFQWFFSFDTTFLHETQGTFQNAIILLDEPGLHLHASAQRDLLLRMKAYAENNQLIYTTHMPFMIDMERLDNIRVCVESKEQGAIVSSDIYSADEHARFPLQAALGLSVSQSLFVGPYNLVVEGVTDFWLISTMATIFQSQGIESIDERIVITPAGGASKAAYVATMLHGQDLNVVVLLDSDLAGQRAAEGLIKKWIIKDRHVLLLGQIIGREAKTELEDILPSDFYLRFINVEYAKELGELDFTLDEISATNHPQIVHRVDEALKARGFSVNSEGKAFNKGRIAKRMLTELPKSKFEDIPERMVENFSQLFKAINRAMPGL